MSMKKLAANSLISFALFYITILYNLISIVPILSARISGNNLHTLKIKNCFMRLVQLPYYMTFKRHLILAN